METKLQHDPRDPINCDPNKHCYIHNVDENDGYLRCFECKHSFRTRFHLIWLDHTVWKKMGERFKFRRPQNIFCCPLCIHDF